MSFDFPNTPSVGDLYPTPATPGLPQYKWDGEKWVVVIAQEAGTVHYDVAQSLTSAQRTQARSNIYAAPFDALAYNGLQFNGSFDTSQEIGLNNGVTASGSYGCDGWKLNRAGTSATYLGAYTWGNSPFGLPNSLAMGVTTAQTTLGANDFVMASHNIEGLRPARLAWGTAEAKPLTIAFWSAHTVTGTHSVRAMNSASNRCYIASYTQVTAGVAQYNVITIPGDTTGTWLKDAGLGIQISFPFAAGSNYIAPAANVWGSTLYVAAPGQVNGVSSTSNLFRILGVVMLPGIEAPNAERSVLIMRPYDQELITCMRYYEKSDFQNYFYQVSNSVFRVTDVRFKTVKRGTPTITLVSPTTTGTWAGGNPALVVAGLHGFEYTGHVGAADQMSSFAGWIADARL